MTDQIHIVDAQLSEQSPESIPDVEDVEVRQTAAYETAEPINPWREYGRDPGRFIRALAEELGKGEFLADLSWSEQRSIRQLDEGETVDLDFGDVRRVDELDVSETDDVDLAVLFAWPDESLLFVGSDPTARDSIPLFGFVVEPVAPIPRPTTAEEALDLLRPEEIRAAFEDDTEPARQGEWWLLPTDMVPVGTLFKPGVQTRPFGPSPLGNHVPREWGMTVTDDEFMAGVRELVDELPASIETPPEVIEWVDRQNRRVPTPEYAPTWDEIQELAGDILVRGTLRHRENDHFVEQLGEEWHRAVTHDMDVFTGDDYIDRVRLD